MLTSFFALCIEGSRASDINVNISSNINADLRTWFHGTYFPPGGYSTNVLGISFYISSFPGSTNGLGIVDTGTGTPLAPSTNNFPVNVTNAVTVYTLINSAEGAYGYTNGTIDFYGSQNAHASFNLVQGINIRDDLNNTFNNIVSSNIMTIYYSSQQCRFDCQGWMLPVSFFSKILTNIQIRSFGNNPDGEPILIAITVRTNGPQLTIQKNGAQAACYWPSTPTNFILQTSATLQNPNWTNVANPPFVTNNQFAVTNALNGSQRFYHIISVP